MAPKISRLPCNSSCCSGKRGRRREYLARQDTLPLPNASIVQERFVPRLEIVQFFELLKPFESYDARLKWNVDETYMAPGSAKSKVVIESSAAVNKVGIRRMESFNEHLTLVICVSAAGEHMIPAIITPRESVGEAMAMAFPEAAWMHQSNGWMDRGNFVLWATQRFLPHVESIRAAIRQPEAAALLVTDGHTSRESSVFLEAMARAHVDVVCLPAHSSHILQPLDLTVFGALKRQLHQRVDFSGCSGLPQKRLALLASLPAALYHALEPGAVAAGFKKAGIHPFDPSAVLEHNSLVPRHPVPDIATSTRRVSISNKVLTSAEVIEDIKLRDAEAEAGKAAKAAKANRKKAKTVPAPMDHPT